MRLISSTIRAALLAACAAGALPAQGRTDAEDRAEAARDRREQAERRRVTVYTPGEGTSILAGGEWDDGRPRAALGVSTSSGGERDTLGVLITAITPGGPADRARLEEGNRIAAINGTNLRLAAADAGEPDMRGMATRRLTRELSKVKPGDEVELRVWQNGQFQTVRVRTVAADSLPGRRTVVRGVTREDRDRLRAERERERAERAVLGLELQASGSRRDTLGVLVTRVAEGGPAERAGIVEGDRVAGVNGVDLRVSRDDAGDGWVSGAKSSRFTREMQRARVGQAVELRVYSGGQFKTVRVSPARAADVYKEGRDNGVFFRSAFGEGESFAPLPPMPPMAPMAPMAPLPPVAPMWFDGPRFDVRVDGEAIGERVREALRAVPQRGIHRI
jgi:hypothetical protein